MRNLLNRPAVLASLIGACLTPSLLATTIWKEGEQPTSTTVERHPWWYDQVKKAELSGNDFISHYSETKTGTVTYQFGVPAAGQYAFWLRANPIGSKMTYRVNDGPAQEINFAGAIDQKNIAQDDAFDHRFIGWVKLRSLDLKPGRFKVEFTFAGGVNNSGSIDCFVLTTDPFTPSGTLKPGQTGATPQKANPGANIADGASWAFVPPPDAFKSDAMLDLRSLNEKVAGQTGFVRLSEDRNSFVKGDGAPIRFWAVVSDAWDKPEAHQREHARWLAKLGVNMVRLHTNISVNDDGADINAVNSAAIENIQRFVSVCKENGIYVTLSPYWAHARAPTSWGIEGYNGDQPWGVLFYNPRFQAAYKSWVRELYTRPNPFANGVALKDEPALAIVQVKNEDSLLFWTFQATKPEQKKLFGKQYFTWAVTKYGSIEKAQLAWDQAKHEDDDIAAGVLGFHLLWDLTQPQTGGKAVRLADMTEFLVDTQTRFYADLQKFYKEELGIKQLTNANNWKSADPVLLDDSERQTYTPMDVSAVNYYVDGLHIGENNGYRIDPGHHIQNRSVLRGEAGFSGALKQTAGHPMMITETAWVNPNIYQTEGPFLMAAYQSLNGVDVAYWFAHGGQPNWNSDPRAMWWPIGDSHATFKWFGNFYGQAAQFPAYAIAFRNGYIEQAKEPAVYEERTLANLYQRNTPIVSESGRFDPNRDQGSFAKESAIKTEIPREAFFVGPVVAKYDGDPKNNRVVDLAKYINATTGDVTSLTGQLTINTKKGISTINAPKIQGVCGFLATAGREFKLADVTITSDNDYATIAAVSLDGLDLKSSKRVLVQVGTTAKLTGFATRPETFEADAKQITGEVIVHNGTPPFRVQNTRVTITLNNPSLTKATLLDPSGYSVRAVELKKSPTGVTIELPPETLWLVIE